MPLSLTFSDVPLSVTFRARGETLQYSYGEDKPLSEYFPLQIIKIEKKNNRHTKYPLAIPPTKMHDSEGRVEEA